MLLVDTTQQLWIAGLRQQKNPRFDGVRGWLLQGDYRLEQPPRRSKTILHVDNSGQFIDALAYDINRYACAALESMEHLHAPEGLPLSTSWLVIKTYYASYFAANALMRLFGNFSTNLDQPHIAQIHDIARLYQVKLPSSESAKLASGVYAGAYKPLAGGHIVSFKGMSSRKGGVHLQFWAGFCEFLDEIDDRLRNEATLTKADLDQSLTSIRDLSNLLKQQTHVHGDWLSAIRNAVNYRLEFGTWHPYSGSQISAAELIDIVFAAHDRKTVRVAAAGESEVSIAVDICGFMVGWMRESMLRLRDMSSAGRRHFLDAELIT